MIWWCYWLLWNAVIYHQCSIHIYKKKLNTWGYLLPEKCIHTYIYIHFYNPLFRFFSSFWLGALVSHTHNKIREKRRWRREREREREKKETGIMGGKTGRHKRVGPKDTHWHFYTFLCVMLFESWMESGPPPPSAPSIHRRPPTLNKKKRKFKTDQFSLTHPLKIIIIRRGKNQFNYLLTLNNFDYRLPIW